MHDFLEIAIIAIGDVEVELEGHLIFEYDIYNID